FKLVEQAGLAHPRFPHNADDLPVSRLGLRQGSPQLLYFTVAADKPGEAALGRDLQARAQRARAYDFVDAQWFFHPLDLSLPQGPERKVARRQPVGLLRDQNGARRG